MLLSGFPYLLQEVIGPRRGFVLIGVNRVPSCTDVDFVMRELDVAVHVFKVVGVQDLILTFVVVECSFCHDLIDCAASYKVRDV